MATKIDHIALSVSNLERSIEFYKFVGHFKLIRLVDNKLGEKLGEVVGLPNTSARIAHLSDGVTMFELFEFNYPKPKQIEGESYFAGLGFIHLGIATTDIFYDWERLVEKNVKFITKPIEFRQGVWMCYFYGPDGEICELRQTSE
jgi:catechol 2,3-dioxygenase-like lactoylglutathione lyase family enzyme